jgi:tRNA (guanine-N7-)-methyltransferase
VDNDARTSDYLARRDSRLSGLRTFLAGALQAGSQSQVTLEIGCGHGHFLTSYADQHPSAFCIGIDLIIDRVARAGRKKDRARLTNLCFLQAEAGEFLDALPANVRIADIFVLFPDPWPKRRHHKNRLIQASFLTKLASRADPGARLCFRTDFAPYFAEASRTISVHDAWDIHPSAPWPHELETVFQSRATAFQSLIAVRNNTPLAESAGLHA